MTEPLKLSVQLASMEDITGYTGDVKETFHKDGAKFLRGLAKTLNLPKDSYEVRSNKGGPAVSGEVTLHSDTLYVQLSESALSRGIGVLYRSCKDRSDYCGGANQWETLQNLFVNPDARERFVDHLKRLGRLD